MNEVLRLAVDWIWLVPLWPLLAALVIGLRMLFGLTHGDAAEPASADEDDGLF